MIAQGFGVMEYLVGCIAAVIGLAVPVGIIYFLVVIYQKVNNIEQLLKKNKEDQ